MESKKHIRRLFFPVVLIVILLIPVIFSGHWSYYVSILSLAGIWTIVVIGLHLLMGCAGQVSLGHAAFFSIGAYTSAILTTRYGWTPLLSFAPAVALTGFAALVIGVPTLKLKEHYLAMATLGVGLIVHSVIKADPGGITGGVTGIADIPALNLFSIAINSDRSQFWLIWSVAAVMFILSENMIDSRFGRALMAIHKSEISASVLGIHVHAYKLKVFVLSAVYAGIAGFLYAHCSPLFYLNPDDTCHFILSVRFVTMVVVGGMTRLSGAVIGAIGLSALPEMLRLSASLLHGVSSTDIEMAIYGLILVLVMIFRPSDNILKLLKFFGALKRWRSS